ncbi:MAG: chemotaxis protein CheW [Polyangiaceae bacterium]
MKQEGVQKRVRLDWEGARRRLAAAQVTPEQQHESAARILAERALRLAKPLESHEASEAWLEVATFRRADRRYAIESRFLVEVGVCGRLTRVPGAHSALLGVTNLRGDLLPVFDLRALGEGGSHEQPLASQLIVLGERSPDFGILADDVDEVTRVSLASLSEPSAVGALPHPEFVRGIDGDGCVLLDGETILRDRSVFVARRSSAALLEREQT